MTFTVDEISTRNGTSNGNSVGSTASRACFAESYFPDAFKRTHDTAQAIGREVRVVAGGAALGAVDHCLEKPVESALQVGATVVVGAGLGTLAVAEVPLISFCAVGAGIGATGVWAVQTFWPSPDNQHKFGEMGRAVQNAWSHEDEATLSRSMQSVRDNGGELAFDLGLIASGAGGVRVGAKHGAWVLKELAKQESLLAPAVVPGYYKSGWFGRGDLVPSLDDLAFFHRRHGKVTTHKGTPETVESLCKKLDAMLAEQEKHSKCGRQTEIDWSREVLVPPVSLKDRGRTFYFQKFSTERR